MGSTVSLIDAPILNRANLPSTEIQFSSSFSIRLGHLDHQHEVLDTLPVVTKLPNTDHTLRNLSNKFRGIFFLLGMVAKTGADQRPTEGNKADP